MKLRAAAAAALNLNELSIIILNRLVSEMSPARFAHFKFLLYFFEYV
jgi:hypothetical protein